jgi:hypothetical protein
MIDYVARWAGDGSFYPLLQTRLPLADLRDAEALLRGKGQLSGL